MMALSENKAVARLSEIIALEHGYPSAMARRIGIAAALHDSGKIKIAPEILCKPGKLTVQEFEVVKAHTVLGAEMLTSLQCDLGKMARDCCRYHHEKWDSSGYWGVSAAELPEYVAITSISDVFVSLISERVYKHAWPPKEAMDYIEQQAGAQFSPELVGVFLPLVRNDSRVPAIFMGVNN
jgi:putative two-component system response regulator